MEQGLCGPRVINQGWHVLKMWQFALFGNQFVGVDLETDDHTSEQPAPKLESKVDTVIVNEGVEEFMGQQTLLDKQGVIG